MIKRVCLILCVIFLNGCATIGKISAINLTNSVGIEFRKVEGPNLNTRTETKPGVDIETTRDFLFRFEYCFRSVNFGGYDLEHGIFFSTSVPLWRRHK